MRRFLLLVAQFLMVAPSLACDPGDLINAVKLDSLELAQAYKAQGCALAPTDNRQVSALELAVLLQRESVFEWLVEDQALVSGFGAEALVTACDSRQQNKKAIELLLSKGVSIDALSKHHYNCLYRAAELPDVPFFNYLIGLGANPERKIVPAPEFHLEQSISVKAFVLQRLADYQALQTKMAQPAKTQK